MKTIKNFLKGLFDSNGNVSSKRVVGVGAFAIIFIAAMADIFKKLTITEFIFWGVIGLVVSCFGLNTFTTVKGMSVKENVATDIVDTEKPDANQTAKAVIESDKP